MWQSTLGRNRGDKRREENSEEEEEMRKEEPNSRDENCPTSQKTDART